jgi:hypothetical protein
MEGSTMIVKKLKSGMILFDNGTECLQVRKERIDSIHIFPPDQSYKVKEWRVQVAGGGYIQFPAGTREEAIEILNYINNVIENAPETSTDNPLQDPDSLKST